MPFDRYKALDYRDFFEPNVVLCYGGGEMASAQIPRMIRSGMNIVGIIDAKKTGTINCKGRKLNILSPNEAYRHYGNTARIIITIANEAIFPEIIDALSHAGFDKSKIYGYDVYNWLMVPSKKCNCLYLLKKMYYHADGLRLCFVTTEDVLSFRFEPFDRGVAFKEHIFRAVEKIEWYHEHILSGYVPLHCNNCPYLTEAKEYEELSLTLMDYASHTVCNADCIYCEYAISANKHSLFYAPNEDAENFFDLIQQLVHKRFLRENAVISIGSGEISMLPARKRFLQFAHDNSGLRFTIHSNCITYSEEIADILRLNKHNSLMCDLDSGTPETYLLVKGFDKFEIVVANLKKYEKYGNIRLKYLVIPDFNTSNDDFLGQISVMKELNISNILLVQDALHEKDLFARRKMIFSISKFMVLLEENGLKGVLKNGYFTDSEQRQIKRYYSEWIGLKARKHEAQEAGCKGDPGEER